MEHKKEGLVKFIQRIPTVVWILLSPISLFVVLLMATIGGIIGIAHATKIALIMAANVGKNGRCDPVRSDITCPLGRFHFNIHSGYGKMCSFDACDRWIEEERKQNPYKGMTNVF